MALVYKESALHFVDEVVSKYRQCLMQHAKQRAENIAHGRGEYNVVVTKEHVQAALEDITSSHDALA